MIRPTVSRSVCLGIKHPYADYDQIFITVRQVRVCWFGALSLWREDGSVVYNCCWPSPEQLFSGPSPLGLATIFYCLRLETSLFVTSYYSQGYGGGIRPRLHTGALTELTPHCLLITYRHEQNRKHRSNCSSIVASRSRRTGRVENTASQLVHWCVLGMCCLATGVVYRGVT
jgi:hypothetical protein